MDGLARTYHRSGVVPDESTFRDFVKGFNKERYLFEFIDAADDKEAADRKLQSRYSERKVERLRKLTSRRREL